MKRFVGCLGGAGLALAAVALLAGCAKSEKDENMVQYLNGNANEVTFLVGVKANPRRQASEHCALYGKQAIFRDIEPAGSEFESFTTGSRPYLYYFDCL